MCERENQREITRVIPLQTKMTLSWISLLLPYVSDTKHPKVEIRLLRGMSATSMVSSIIHMDKRGKVRSKIFPPSQNDFMATLSRHTRFLSPLSYTAPKVHI